MTEPSPIADSRARPPLDSRVWPSVPVVMFQDSDEMYWRDGKPWCRRHRGCLVRPSTIGLAGYPIDHRLCPDCMTESYEASPNGRNETPS